MSLEEQDRSDQTTPYQAAGELVGITKLVDEFYANMDTLPEAETNDRVGGALTCPVLPHHRTYSSYTAVS